MTISMYQKILLFQGSNAILVFEINSLNVRIMFFVSRMSILRELLQGKLTFRFGMLIGELTRQITQTSILFYWGYSKERVYTDNPQTIADLREAFGKEISSVDSKVTEVILDSVKKGAQD